jgi:hypothetical protein
VIKEQDTGGSQPHPPPVQLSQPPLTLSSSSMDTARISSLMIASLGAATASVMCRSLFFVLVIAAKALFGDSKFCG